MAKMISQDKAKQFYAFLQTHIFKDGIKSFRPFRGGNSSYCFWVETKEDKWVAKILFNKYTKDRLHTFLAQTAQECPVLRGIKMDKVFQYHGKDCTIQKNYGRPLPRRHFDTKIIQQIFHEYTKITDLSTAFGQIDSAFNPRHLLEIYAKAEQNLTEQENWHAKILRYFLHKINPDTLIFSKEKIRIIHGDFNNNQVLLENGKLSAFIDWETLRTGYPAEDYWEFIYFNLRHLYNPCMYEYWRRRIVSQVASAVNSEYGEWETAINGMLVLWLHRLSQPQEYKVKRLLKFFYLYHISTQTLKQLKKQ